VHSSERRIVVGQPEHDGALPARWHEPDPGLTVGQHHFGGTLFTRQGLRETDLSGFNVPVGAVAQLVATSNEGRHEVVITNTAAPAVPNPVAYVGRDATVSAQNGLELFPGQSVTYKHYRGDVWAIVPAGGPATLSWQEE
jgi:hypothetical protein